MPAAPSWLDKVKVNPAEPAILAKLIVTHMLCLLRGYTRKEPFANGIWTPKAENWNGRTAMIGFTGIVLTEALAGKSVLEVSCGIASWCQALHKLMYIVLNDILLQCLCYNACAFNQMRSSLVSVAFFCSSMAYSTVLTLLVFPRAFWRRILCSKN
jgi:hypothetical protein